MFLLDTNIISEVRKGERCDRRVADWYASIEDSDLFLSVLVIGEIRRGVELARRNDSAKSRCPQTCRLSRARLARARKREPTSNLWSTGKCAIARPAGQ